ncbi:MAG: insulinase family protein [Selenomonadaceae bacterium]|nr:insulinase family protein [Selenomonadaceae bacterium]MDY2686380.1 insulinase family protein [Selenomonadaceae bacterium]
MQVNDRIHGFKILKKSKIEETASTAYTMEHVKSGARLFYLENEDDNKVFSISFRTPPTDDTGVAHIVEHSTLCGSRKYPLKEPFVELVKGSLNTFLNAMTYPDKTMYPVASRNDKDFQNLMDVYLDAVFYPAMRENPQILMQEGWHYEIEKPEDPLQYSGVVFNEMKGALSAPDDLLESRILSSLYPDTTYFYESGGDPAAIPQLTQEKFIAFHSKYYHPSNSYIYLYGKMDIEEKLRYLDEQYLSAFDRIEVPSHIARQKPFTELHKMTSEYPVLSEDERKEKTFLALSWQMGGYENPVDEMGISVLEHALFQTEAAPVRKAIIDARLGKDVDTQFETDLQQPYFSIELSNSEPDRAEAFYQLVMDTLKKVADEGIDKTLLTASLNLTEFRLREADFGTAPKGLIYGIQLMKSWLYGGDPETPLRYEAVLPKLREGIENGYFEDLIRKYFLENHYASFVTLKPSLTIAGEREEKQKKELAARKAAMSSAEIEQVIASTKALKARQQSEETPEALATIPVLERRDIKQEPDRLPLEVRSIDGMDGVKLLYSDVETHGIAYLDLYLDTKAVAQKDIPYLYLLIELLGAVDTKRHSYAELANLKNLYTGGISYEILAARKNADLNACEPYLHLRTKALRKYLPKVFDLVTEILTDSLFTDKKRVRELIEQTLAAIELNLQRSAHQVVLSKIHSYLTKAGSYADIGGLPFYAFLQDFLAHFDTAFVQMQQAFARIWPRVMNQHRLLVSLTGREAEREAFTAALPKLYAALSAESFADEAYAFAVKPLNEGLTSSSQVQYVGQGANFRALGYDYTGAMRVLETILRYGFFWTKIRVQGGAYGAFVRFPRNGDMFFGSYRDPNLAETYEVFAETADFVRHFDASERELTKAVIGTISLMDTPLTPRLKGEAAVSLYLSGTSYADLQEERAQVLQVTADDIRGLADLVETCMQQHVLCTFGGEKKVRENAAIFGTVHPAL